MYSFRCLDWLINIQLMLKFFTYKTPNGTWLWLYYFSLRTPRYRRKSKLHNLYTQAPFAQKTFYSSHYPGALCVFTLHTSVYTALPPHSPADAWSPSSDATFSPKFAFPNLPKGWIALSSVFPQQSAAIPFITLIFHHQCLRACLDSPLDWRQTSYITQLLSASACNASVRSMDYTEFKSCR